MKQIFYIASKIHTPQPNFENIYNKIIWFLLNFNNLKAIKYKKKYGVWVGVGVGVGVGPNPNPSIKYNINILKF